MVQRFGDLRHLGADHRLVQRFGDLRHLGADHRLVQQVHGVGQPSYTVQYIGCPNWWFEVSIQIAVWYSGLDVPILAVTNIFIFYH